MSNPLSDLSKCRILISNDDGINAEGIRILEKIARQLSDDVWVVAPATEQSGAGHSLTLHLPLRPVEHAKQRWTVSGTPTDCVMVAINTILKDKKPDLVLSGINMGSNLGEDVHYSGTVAAALEGALLGVPAIALSQEVVDGKPVSWAAAERHMPDLIRRMCAAGWPANVLLNVNIPNVEGAPDLKVVAASQGKHKLGDDLILREDPRGRAYIWIGARRSADKQAPGTDLKAVDEGCIAVTPLNVDLTHRPTLDALRDIL